MLKLSAKLKFLLLNLLIALIIVSGIVIYVLYWLDDYTQHGTFIEVPPLQDYTPEEAEAIATHAGLRIMVIDSLYDNTANPGTVVEQYPAPGARVKENRLIHLTINARNPEKVVFPNLKNAAYRQTLQTLQARGFKIGRIEYVPSEFRNLVLNLQSNGKDIEAGSLLSKGSTIDILLGTGEGNNFIYTPSLKGKNLREAINTARYAYLNIGETIPDGSLTPRDNKNAAFVYQQHPKANTLVKAGTPISLYITLKKEKLAVPDSLIISE